MNDQAVAVYLAQFQSMRDEIFCRLESQRQSFNYLMGLIAAATALAASDKLDLLQVNFPAFALLLPFLAAPLAFIFFDNELLIWSIKRFIECELRPRLRTAVGEDALILEDGGFTRLARAEDALHVVLSTGRWLLFLLPTLLPVLYAVRKQPWKNWPFSTPFGLVFTFDCVALAILVWAMAASVAMRRKSSRKVPTVPPVAEREPHKQESDER